MLIFGLLFVALQIDRVQTFVSKQMAGYLSEKLNTHVSIDAISIRFVRSIILKGFYIQDLHGDTLVYAGELNLLVDDISTSQRKLDISAIVFKNGMFNLVQYKGEKQDNLQFVIDYFSSEDTVSESAPWRIKVRSLTLENLNFRNTVEDDSLLDVGVDFSHLNVKNIYGKFTGFENSNDSLSVKIRKLSFYERSGFLLNEFSSQVRLTPKNITLDELSILTPYSNIETNLVFHFDSLSSFNEFTSQVSWESAFKTSQVSFRDISYFATDLAGVNRSVNLRGEFKGKINNFKGKNVNLQWGKNSVFKGNVSMRGLPYIDDTYLEVYADLIKTDKADVEWFPLIPFEEGKHITVPENLKTLGVVTFKGKFNGFFNDFVAYGDITTALGSISSDLNLKFDRKTNASEYSGKLSATEFDIGKIALMNDLGKVTFQLNVKGAGLKLDNINARLEGNVEALSYRNYIYRNIALNADIAKKLFNGTLNIQEENVDLDFKGTIDYRNKLPEFNFIANIQTARLDLLNIFRTDRKTVLQTSIRSRFIGNNLDNLEGSIDIQHTNFQSGQKLYYTRSILINADKTDNQRIFTVSSDNIDANFHGEFELARLGDAIKEILPQYLPSVILPKKNISGRQNFSFDIRIKNLNVFTETAFPSWDFAPNTTIVGKFTTLEKKLSLKINSQQIIYDKFLFNDFNTTLSGDSGRLDITVKASQITRDGKTLIDFPELATRASENKVNFNLKLSEENTHSSYARLQGVANFFSAKKFTLTIDSSLIVIENKAWTLNPNNFISVDSSLIQLADIDFSNMSESVQIDGSVGKSPGDKLLLSLSGFRLGNINSILGSNSTILGGEMTGFVSLRNVYTNPMVESDIAVSDLALNGDTLGNATLKSAFNSELDFVFTDVNIIKGKAKVVDIQGRYYIKREQDNLDFTVRLSNLYVHPLERYINDIMTDVYGKVSADLKLSGTFNKPVFEGTVDLNKMSLVVNYLNTRYSFTTAVRVKNNSFILDELKIVDENNNSGIAKGKITHNYFSDFRFDVELVAKKFQVLNTSLKDNSLYYGQANATGYATFHGPIENMTMDISLSPDKGTVVNIPLNTSEDLLRSNFITFINRSKAGQDEIIRSQVDLSGIKLNMNLDLNPNALINIIFDEKIGDVISGRGSGSLKLDINTSGNFSMYGTYEIEKGDYLFTLQNLINKKFNIDPGGRITWSGDPYEATIDISAVYVVYTSTLSNVLPEDSTNRRRVPVDCRIFLTNKLMNPTISYEITVRGLAPTEEGLLKTILNSEEQINMQMLGLLLFNQFFPTPGASQSITRLSAGAGAGASASELLSNQVSNWLGQLSKDVNIGINYRSKDTYTNEEVKLIFSKSLLNDRLLLEGNVGYLGDQSYVNSNVVGDFNAEYKVSPDGRFRIKGFNRSNADNIINYSQAPYSQGFGVFYRQEFNSWKDLMIKWRLAGRKEEAKSE